MPFFAKRAIALDIRIALFLGRSARMGERAETRRTHLLGVFPQIAGPEFLRAWLPFLLPLIEFALRQLDVERSLHGIELDDVAVAQKRDRSADRGLGTDMADAESAGGARKTAVSDERDLGAHALSVKRGGGRKHFTHPGTALRPLVADDQHVAFLVRLFPDRLEASFLAVEATRRTGELQALHPGNLNNGALGREIALEANDAAGRQ